MSPVRSPSPFETSDPGDALLNSTASINLEGPARVSIPGPSITSKPAKGEFILLKTEHMCPVEPNGGKARCRTSLAGFLKGLAKAGVRVFLPGDDSNSVDSKEAELGTLSIILSTKKAMFDDALAGLESLSKSVYVRAFIDPEAGDGSSSSVEDVIRRVEKAGLLSWDCEGGDVGDEAEAVHDHVDTGGRSLASGFVLINVHNDLGGEGQGFLQMQELDDNDHNGDIDVCYSGTGF